MKKPSKLLKVFSIILIVFGGISLFSAFVSITMRSTMEQYYTALGQPTPTTLTYVLLFVGSVVLLASGIIGVSYKSKQLVLIMGIILAVYYVFNIIYTAVTISFSPISLISIVLPILYLWGWYQSN